MFASTSRTAIRVLLPCTCRSVTLNRLLSTTPASFADPSSLVPTPKFWKLLPAPNSDPISEALHHLPVILPEDSSASPSNPPSNPSPKRNQNNQSTRSRSSSSSSNKNDKPSSSTNKGFFGFLRGRSRNAPSALDAETLAKRNLLALETERALERTLRAGGKVQGSGGIVGGLNVRCTTLNKKGDVTSTKGEFNKGELCTRYGIQPRDLRKLDSAVPTVVPTILVRRAAILVRILTLWDGDLG